MIGQTSAVVVSFIFCIAAKIMRLPIKGHIVLFRLSEGSQVPAIVMQVRQDEEKDFSLDLTVFTGRNTDPVRYTTFIVQGSDVGQWQWPDIPIQ